jgi:hypothetical protein
MNKHRNIRGALAIIAFGLSVSPGFAQTPPRDLEFFPVWSSHDGELVTRGQGPDDMFKPRGLSNPDATALLSQRILICAPQMAPPRHMSVQTGFRDQPFLLAGRAEAQTRRWSRALRTSFPLSGPAAETE